MKKTSQVNEKSKKKSVDLRRKVGIKSYKNHEANSLLHSKTSEMKKFAEENFRKRMSNEEFLKFSESFSRGYKEICKIFDKNSIKPSEDFKWLIKKARIIENKAYTWLFNFHYPLDHLLKLKRDFRAYSNLLDELLRAFKKPEKLSFWSEIQDEKVKDSSKVDSHRTIRDFLTAKKFNDEFKAENADFLTVFNLHSTLNQAKKEEFDQLQIMQQNLTNKIEELEANNEFQDLLKDNKSVIEEFDSEKENMDRNFLTLET